MAECYACSKPFRGSWNIIFTDSLYEDARRYFDISDGHLLYVCSPNWIFCYCNSCWQKYVLSLSLISNAKQVNTLKEQKNSLQQQLGILRQQHTSLQQKRSFSEQNYTTLRQQYNSLQRQLILSRAETTVYKKQLVEMSEKYNKLSNISGIAKLRDLIKQLTSSQIDALHSHTNFRVDIVEAMHIEQQSQCSKQYTMSTIVQLKSSLNLISQLQNDILVQTKKAKENIFQTLTTAGISEVIKDASIKPLEIEIEEIEVSIQAWNTFSVRLTDIIEQRASAVDVDVEVKVIEKSD